MKCAGEVPSENSYSPIGFGRHGQKRITVQSKNCPHFLSVLPSGPVLFTLSLHLPHEGGLRRGPGLHPGQLLEQQHTKTNECIMAGDSIMSHTNSHFLTPAGHLCRGLRPGQLLDQQHTKTHECIRTTLLTTPIHPFSHLPPAGHLCCGLRPGQLLQQPRPHRQVYQCNLRHLPDRSQLPGTAFLQPGLSFPGSAAHW